MNKQELKEHIEYTKDNREKTDRNNEMKRLRYEERWSAEKIGLKFGLTRERVFQVVGRGRVEKVNCIRTRSVNPIIRDILLNDLTSLTTEEAADRLGVGKALVKWNGRRHKISSGSTTAKGFKVEEWVSEQLTQRGINHELTNSRPIDIVLSSGKTVEIKSRHKKDNEYTRTAKAPFYQFHVKRDLEKENAPDYFVLVIVRKKYKDLFIIPAKYIPEHGGVGFCWPEGNNVGNNNWQQYHNRFDLLV